MKCTTTRYPIAIARRRVMAFVWNPILCAQLIRYWSFFFFYFDKICFDSLLWWIFGISGSFLLFLSSGLWLISLTGSLSAPSSGWGAAGTFSVVPTEVWTIPVLPSSTIVDSRLANGNSVAQDESKPSKFGKSSQGVMSWTKLHKYAKQNDLIIYWNPTPLV